MLSHNNPIRRFYPCFTVSFLKPRRLRNLSKFLGECQTRIQTYVSSVLHPLNSLFQGSGQQWSTEWFPSPSLISSDPWEKCQQIASQLFLPVISEKKYGYWATHLSCLSLLLICLFLLGNFSILLPMAEYNTQHHLNICIIYFQFIAVLKRLDFVIPLKNLWQFDLFQRNEFYISSHGDHMT